jgi:SAM-dependent MidA family methyltransferase
LADIIQFIYTLRPKLLKTLKFAIVERYKHLQDIQKKYFKDSFGDEINLTHYNLAEELKLSNAFIVANEIFDAFSCELVYTKGGKLQQAFIEDEKIVFENSNDENLIQLCKKYKISKGEIAVGFEEFAKTLSKNIQKFTFLTFDYGELYARGDFSIRVYEKHNVYPLFEDGLNLKNLFGKSDITYDVNFSHLIDSFKKYNIKKIKYTTQLKALVDFGIIELLEILHKNTDETTYLREVNKVKTLLEPTSMGDRFKVVIFQKGDL